MAQVKVNPNKLVSRRVCYVDVLGKIWMPMVAASMRYQLSDYDLENIGEFTRESVESWLGTHAGDFSSIKDFHAVCGDADIPWTNEENEMEYFDTLGNDE